MLTHYIESNCRYLVYLLILLFWGVGECHTNAGGEFQFRKSPIDPLPRKTHDC